MNRQEKILLLRFGLVVLSVLKTLLIGLLTSTVKTRQKIDDLDAVARALNAHLNYLYDAEARELKSACDSNLLNRS